MACHLVALHVVVLLFLCVESICAGVNRPGSGKGLLLVEKENHGIKKRQVMGGKVAVNGRVVDVSPITPGSDPYEQCYANIGVYTSESAKVGLPGAEVTLVSLTDYNDTHYQYKGYSRGITNVHGQVCLVMICYDIGIAYVTTENERLFVQTDVQELPPRFRVSPMSNNEELLFYGFVFGTVAGKTGPVYTYHEKHLCDANGLNDYHFVFSYLSIPDELTETPVPTISSEPIPDTRTWYYGLTKRDRQTCYLKLMMRVVSSQVKVELRSLNPNTLQSYGTFISGPKNDPDSQDKPLKVACLQFRCPTLMVDRNDTMDTLVEGKITVPGKPEGCTVR